jgi:hypothetical protein
MKLIFASLFFAASTTFAASKVVERFTVLEEKTIAATGCSVSGEDVDIAYGQTGYKYTATMKINVQQKVQAYSVLIKKPFFGKPKETLIPNSTKSAPDRVVAKTQSITYVVRSAHPQHVADLKKACEDESLFINTGAYPPPPPKPVIPEPPKKEPKPVTPPTVPTLPNVPGVPGVPETPELFPIVPEATPEDTGLPGIPATPVPKIP